MCPVRQRAAYPRHHVGLRFAASKGHRRRISEEQHAFCPTG